RRRCGHRRALRARLDLQTDLLLTGVLEGCGADYDVPGSEAVRLEDDDVVRGAPSGELARDHLLELVHLEPVEDAALDGLDQIARLEARLLDRVAANEDRPLEDDVVELSRARLVCADRADERARLKPL